MRILRAWFLRVAGLFGRELRDRELSAEMESHLELHFEDNLRRGMSPAEARRLAFMKLGGIEQTKQTYRERRGLPILETLLQDFGYGLRMLWKNPGFTATAVVTLALGIGVNTTIFSIAEAFLVHPLALPSLHRLVAVTNGQKRPVAPADYFEWKLQSQLLEHLSAYRSLDMNLTGTGEPERVYGAAVTADFFLTLGVDPSEGRAFSSDEDELGRNQVVILSHGLWQRRFGANRAVLGK